MLRKIRIVIECIVIFLVTMLFLDFTGTIHAWFGWVAKIQFVPAILAMNFAIVIILVLITLIFGRIYCSVICPLGIFQDIIAYFGRAGSKKKKYRFKYRKERPWLRYTFFALFVVALILGIVSVYTILEPYSAFGRMASNLLRPFYLWGNNALTYISERIGGYTLYKKEVIFKGISTFIIAVATFVLLFILAWKKGRIYCNTICPVGTFLGFISRFSLFRPRIDVSKCTECRLCGRQCKASCIDVENRKIDYSRCIVCFDCIDACRSHAITYSLPLKSRKKKEEKAIEEAGNVPAGQTDNGCGDMPNGTERLNDVSTGKIEGGKVVEKADKASDNDEGMSRRDFLAVSALLLTTVAAAGNNAKKLPMFKRKTAPDRQMRITPPGGVSLEHFTQHCTACQLCVSACPNQVLRPSKGIVTFMQPESSYEKGFCSPDCNKCSQVCPAGAIRPISIAQKSKISIGCATWVKERCFVYTKGAKCGVCSMRCPNGAISMLPVNGDNSAKFPVVDRDKCVGCGICEYYCPARPLSAIYVEGYAVHKSL